MVLDLGRNVGEVRSTTLRALMELTHSNVGSYYQLVRSGSALEPQFHATDGEDVERAAQLFRSQVPTLVPTMSATFQRTMRQPGFLNAAQCYGTGDAYEQHPMVQQFLHPAGYVDQLRLAIFEEGRHVAWFGVLRRKGEPKFSPAEHRAANRVAENITTMIITTDRMERAHAPAEGCDLLVTPDGQVELASPSGRKWLARPEASARVKRLVALAERRRSDELCTVEGSSVFRIARLDAEGRVRYLLQLRPAVAYHLSPTQRLTTKQREVGSLLARGCTIDEVARHLGSGRETVRTHLRQIYQRLAIASRAELASVFADELRDDRG